MTATIISVNTRGLLVRNNATGEEVFVNFRNTRPFRPGDIVRITYTGTMTFSIPPQITATSVVRLRRPQFRPQPQPQPPTYSEIRRARITRVGRNVLHVIDLSNNRPVIVNYAGALNFRVGQLVRVRYETVFLGTQMTVIATDVSPIF